MHTLSAALLTVAILLSTTDVTCTGSEAPGDVAAETAADPDGKLRLKVNVVDTAARPVANAACHVLVLTDEQRTKAEVILFDGNAALSTNAAGELMTGVVEAGKSYLVEVSAPGMLPAISLWTRPADRGIVELPAVVLRRLLTVEGTVAGRDGKGIPEAAVIQAGDGPERTSVVSDANGAFRIDGVPEGVAFLFVEKEGYRFHGQQVAAEKGPVKIILERTDAASPRMYRALPPRRIEISQEQRQALAVKLLKPTFDEMLGREPPQTDRGIVRALAQTDPELVLDQRGRLPIDDTLRSWIAVDLFTRDQEKALAMVRRMDDPESQFWSLIRMAEDEWGPRDEDQTRRLLADACAATKAIGDVGSRIGCVSELARRLIKSGDRRTALIELTQAQALAEKLPEEDRKQARVQIAAPLCNLDPAQALKLVADAAPYMRVELARHLALTDPAQAELFLSTVGVGADPQFLRWNMRFIPQVGIRAATTDPDRAERMMRSFFDALDSIVESNRGAAPPPDAGNEKHQPIGKVQVALLEGAVYGRLAETAATDDKARAHRLFRHCLAELMPLREGHIDKPRNLFYSSPASVLATLLPVAEKIDPALAHEVFWIAPALCPDPLPGEGEEQVKRDLATACHALMLNRFEPAVASALLEPVLQRDASRRRRFSWVEYVEFRVHPQAAVTLAEDADPAPLKAPAAERDVARRVHAADRIYRDENQLRADPRKYLEIERENVREMLDIYIMGPGDDY